MMNFTTMQISTSEFDRAMVEYAAASGKDFKDIVNRQLLNLSIQGGKLNQESRKIRDKAIREYRYAEMAEDSSKYYEQERALHSKGSKEIL